MLHKFNFDIDKGDLPPRFTFPFCYVPHRLVAEAAKLTQEHIASRNDWKEELDDGKMFGVLVAEDATGTIGFLAAFSGNIAHSNNHPFFVPPIYDLLSPDGFFRKKEATISEINVSIAKAEQSQSVAALKESVAAAEKEASKAIEEFSLAMKEAKKRRDAARISASREELAAMERESQFQKAEMKRLKKRHASAIAIIREKLSEETEKISAMKEERKRLSAALQKELFDHFRIRNAKGDTRGLCSIFSEARQELPPAGAGECAAPKLLQYAYTHNLRPIAMGEFWWGSNTKHGLRRHLHFYPACKSKCEPILNFMLQGLDVDANPLLDRHPTNMLATVYEDDFIWVADKPEGMLSVPGKDGTESVYDIARQRFPEATGPLIVHRLDMHTSGLIIVAKTKEAHKCLQAQFNCHSVRKEYIAILSHPTAQDKGEIDLPLRPDFDNRPRQTVDFWHGKPAHTEFKVLHRNDDGTVRIAFYPATGRTHQLRVHSAHPAGLNSPIKGDMLYGTPSDRLYLHAAKISFVHPATGKQMTLCSETPF